MEYIEQGGNPIEFGTFHIVGRVLSTPVNPNTIATLTRKNSDGGVTVLESQLRIVTLSNFQTASVSCVHGNGARNISRFQLLGMYKQVLAHISVCTCRDVKYNFCQGIIV